MANQRAEVVMTDEQREFLHQQRSASVATLTPVESALVQRLALQ
jgi:hypothetical protein